MLRKLSINNFKSLGNFSLHSEEMPLGQLICLIGLNGAGKSTVLQAIDFLSVLTGDVKSWLKDRGWAVHDLKNKSSHTPLISFDLLIELEGHGELIWSGAWNTTHQKMSRELVTRQGQALLRLSEGSLLVEREGKTPLPLPIGLLNFAGSSLGLLTKDMHPALRALKTFMSSLMSLELLSPHSMRSRARRGTDIGRSGERLSAFIHGLDKPQRETLLAQLQRFYPQIIEINTHVIKSGWVDLSIKERFAHERPLETYLRHINDGTLRTLAILAQTLPSPTPRFILLDEVENGINPELINQLLTHLRESGHQVLVTTHSPMILNYLPDEVAREAVRMLYRNAQGYTRSVPFFSLPETDEKLGVLGAGEVFVDTDLIELTERLSAERG